jgi:DNA-binding NarL/FixJ family response regulator
LARLRIIVADDNPPFLDKLVSLLESDVDIVATAADGKSALRAILRYKPDVVVLDLHMPELDGLEVTKELAKHPDTPPVVICSVETDPELVEATRQAGAIAYVFKLRVERDLILAVKSAAQGRPFVSPVSASH